MSNLADDVKITRPGDKVFTLIVRPSMVIGGKLEVITQAEGWVNPLELIHWLTAIAANHSEQVLLAEANRANQSSQQPDKPIPVLRLN